MDLKKYLMEKKTKQKVHTHTRIGASGAGIYGGKYNIDDLETFWNLYNHYVFVKKGKEYLTERQIPNGQLLIDLDFNYAPNIKSRQHNDEIIEDIIDLYLEKLNKIFIIPVGDPIKVWVLEKPNVNCLENKTKDGLHIVIGIQMSKDLQLLLREKVLKDIDKILSDLPLQNTYEDVLDKGISKGTCNWQVYGSRKPNHEAYEIIKYYDVCFNFEGEIVREPYTLYTTKEVLPIISARYEGALVFETQDNIKEQLIKFKAVANKVKKKKQKEKKKNKEQCKGKICYEVVQEKFNFIALELLEDTQKAAGIVLKCASTGDAKIKELLHKLMSQAKNYDGEWVDNVWDSYDKEKHADYYFTYGYLKQIQHNLLIEACKTECDFDLAKAVVYLKYGDIAYYKVDNKILIWNGHYWQYEKPKTDCALICKWIYKDLFNAICFKQIKIIEQTTRTIDEKEREKLQKYTQQLEEIKCKCKKEAWQKNIVSMVIKIVKNDFEVEEINMADDFFVFQNKTWDLLKNRWVQPKSIKHLYNTLSSPHNWREPTEKEIETLNKIIKEIMMDEETRNALLIIMSTGLSGRCLQKFISFIGGGRNGKGLLNALMLKLLGKDYGCDPNVAVLCNKQKSGGCPELANLGDKRYARFGEPDEDLNKMNWGICKGLTGGDPIKARKLHSNKTEYKNSLTTIIERQDTANILISGDGCDNASIKRMLLLEFKSFFTDEKEKWNGIDCFPANTEYVTTKFKLDHVFALFKILRDAYYEFSKTNTIYLSKDMEKATKGYLKKCDEFMVWFDYNYTTCDNNESIPLKDIKDEWMDCDDYRNLTANMKRSRGLHYIKQKLINRFGTYDKKDFKSGFGTGKFKKRHLGKRNVFVGLKPIEEVENEVIDNESSLFNNI